MEDKKIEELEDDKNLNQEKSEEETKADAKVETTETKTFTLEEVEAIKKDMQSNSEKWVQKLVKWQKAYKLAMSNLSNISENPEELVELYSENEEAAQIILDTYYDWQDINAFKESIEYKVDYSDPKVIDALVEKKLAKKVSSDLITNTKSKFIKDLDIKWEELEKFEAEFTDRQGLKSFNPDTISKHLEAAYRDISWNEEQLKKLQKWEIVWKAMTKSEGKWGNSNKETKNASLKKDISDFMKLHKL